ncbi:uncharacterized protein Dwil_GK21452 [Drosophila willistoni]|uniref:GK21452 n=1 Tax=Drosophila willistoni TaxID=7260 RepID=B4MQB0_DROWI|nr:calmodulin-A [Drosophila willistoni]EDW74299.1 uncharacterized protein Dwil_GK21452 [Drosophila willistoni]
MAEQQELTNAQIEEMREQFQVYDQDGGGTIQAPELCNVLTSMGNLLTEAEVYELIDSVDVDGNREIDFPEFLTMMAPRIFETERNENLEKAFQFFDRDGDGYFNWQDIKAVTSNLGVSITDEEIKMILREVDANGDNRVHLSEFMTFMRENRDDMGRN